MASVAVKRQQLCNCVRCVFTKRKNSTNLRDVRAEGPTNRFEPVRVYCVRRGTQRQLPLLPHRSQQSSQVQGRGRRRGVGS